MILAYIFVACMVQFAALIAMRLAGVPEAERFPWGMFINVFTLSLLKDLGVWR